MILTTRSVAMATAALGVPVLLLIWLATRLVPVGKALAEEFGDRFVGKPESAWLATFKEKTADGAAENWRATAWNGAP